METIPIILDTGGSCFFCCGRSEPTRKNKRNQSLFEPERTLLQLEYASLQILFHHLRIDWGELLKSVGIEGNNEMRREDVRVPVCFQCSKLLSVFLELYESMDVMEMKLRSCLGEIQGLMRRATATVGKDEKEPQGESRLLPEVNLLAGQQKDQGIVKKLRETCLEKCFQNPSYRSRTLKIEMVEMQSRAPPGEPETSLKSESEVDEDREPTASEGRCDNEQSPAWEPVGDEDMETQSDNDGDFQPAEGINDSERESGINAETETSGRKLNADQYKNNPNPVPEAKTEQNEDPDENEGDKSIIKITIPDADGKIRRSKEYPYSFSAETRIYKCEVCEAEFGRRNAVKRHIQLTHMGIRYQCPTCGKLFTDKSSLNEHSLFCSTKPSSSASEVPSLPAASPQYFCSLCNNKPFKSLQTLQNHQKFVHPPPGAETSFPCDHENCTKVFSNPRNLNEHKRYVHSGRTFLCQEVGCGKSFKVPFQLSVHMKRYHENEPNESSNNTEISTDYTFLPTEKKYKCNPCGKIFSFRSSFRAHYKKFHEAQTGASSSVQKVEPDPVPTEKPFKCKICDKSYAHKGSLSHHKATHLDVPKAFCETCGKKFQNYSLLKHHIEFAHLNVRFKCGLETGSGSEGEACAKIFTSEKGLREHQRKDHGYIPKPAPKKPKPVHRCDVCGRVCSSAKDLLIHIKTVHLKVKDIPCQFCDKMYGTKAELMNHEKAAHFNVQYKCDQPGCNRSYRFKSGLRAHLRARHLSSKKSNPKKS